MLNSRAAAQSGTINSIYECDGCGLGTENGEFYEVDLSVTGEAILGQKMEFTSYTALGLGLLDKDFALRYEVDPGI